MYGECMMRFITFIFVIITVLQTQWQNNIITI